MDKNSKTKTNQKKPETTAKSPAKTMETEINNSHFHICVRVRPLNQKELKYSNVETIRVIQNNTIAIIDASDIKEDRSKAKEKHFIFDHAFDKSADQDNVYEHSTKSQIFSVVQGYNLTVFAYGATGAGKTHTMLGTGEHPGIMPHSIYDLFDYIEKEESDFKIKITYIEVYNETLRDLLANSEHTIDLRDDPKLGSMIVGAKEIIVTNTHEVFNLLMRGNKNRTTEATTANEESSRSHALLNISVENNSKTSKNAHIGNFMLVDLAGSERSSNTKDALRNMESGNINKSLLALGTVINGLVDQSEKKMKVFIPWRDSKLTRILKNSLAGNAKIVMIANISASVLSIEETINTLKYANRAKNIKTSLKKNVIENSNISNFDHIIDGLKNEIEDLRHQLAVKTHNNLLNKKVDVYPKQVNKQEKIQNDIAMHFQEETKFCKEILDDEKKLESFKNDLQDKEYELFQFEKLKLHKPGKQQQLNNITKSKYEIELLNKQIEEKYSIYNNEVKVKREEINKQINNILNKDPISGNNLSLQYQYHCVLIENMTLEHKKKYNVNHIRKKDFQINKLVNQIKLRDDVISSANQEMKKNKINLEFPDDMKEIDELDIEQSMILPLIVDKSTVVNKDNANHLKTNSTSFNNINSRSHMQLPLINNYDVKKLPKSRNSNSPVITPRGGYNYNGYSNPLVNKPLKTFKTKTNNIINLLKQKQLTDLRLNIVNGSYANSKLQYGKDNKTLGYGSHGGDHDNNNKINFSMDNSTDSSNQSFSIAERQIQKKAKNILRTNLLSRYKNSPYIKK